MCSLELARKIEPEVVVPKKLEDMAREELESRQNKLELLRMELEKRITDVNKQLEDVSQAMYNQGK